MKKKTSISISEQLMEMIDHLPGEPNRSEVIEEALLLYFRTRQTIKRDQSDLDILNAQSKELNEEALDVLDYQPR
jgi:metal-responsive CopG/Arc/MetJ family transcriptional regulator